MPINRLKVTLLARATLVIGLMLSACTLRAGQTNSFPHTLADLRARLDTQLNDRRFSGALWGVQIVSLTTGKTVYSNHADRLMSPASNSKLYTAALALDTLGGDYRIHTPVYATAFPDDFGRIQGDLIISGRCDPSWKATKFSDNFTPFISVLTNAGVRSVTGDLIVDDTFLKGVPTGSSWCVDDLEQSFGAGIYAISLEDNIATFRATPGQKPGDPCRIELSPPDTQIKFINRVKTVVPGEYDPLEVFQLPGASDYHLFGGLPPGTSGEELEVPVPNPSRWFGVALKNALARNGIRVSGQVRSVAWPEVPSWSPTNLAKLGVVTSPPLRELIRDFLKPSQNLETDLIFEQVGELSRTSNTPPEETSESLAVTALESFVKAKGIPADVHFDEGSGLSRNNLTSAAATAALLAVMATNRWSQDYYEGLPVAGVDGSLRHRMRGTPAANNVHAKTGTLRWANSLSGYVTTASGEHLAFSLMLNRYDPPPNTRPADELDTIAVLLAGYDGSSKE